MENKSLWDEKKTIKSLCAWTSKQNKTITITYATLLFVTLFIIMSSAFTLSAYSRQEDVDIEGTLRSILVISIFVGIIFTLISGVNSFSYLHNKRTVDLFYAFPMSRKGIFIARYISVVKNAMIPAIIISIIISIVNLIFENTMEIYYGVFVFLVSIIANTSFIAIITVCVGTVVNTIIFYMIFSCLLPLGIFLMEAIPTSVVPGVTSGFIEDYMYYLFTPMFAPFIDLGLELKYCIIYIVWWVIFSVIALALTLRIVKRRKSEMAQTSDKYGILGSITKFLVSYVPSLLVAWFFAQLMAGTNSAKAVYIFYFAIFIILNFGIGITAHLIENKSFAGIVSTLKINVLAFLVGVIYTVSYVTGYFGQDMYVPEIDDIASVIIKDGDMEYCQINGKSISYEFTEEDDIVNIVNIHREITENIDDTKHKGLYSIVNLESDPMDMSVGITEYYPNEFSIEYKLKNGDIIERYYTSTYGEITASKDWMFVNMVANKKLVEALTAKDVDSIYFYDTNTGDTLAVNRNGKKEERKLGFIKMFLEGLTKDLNQGNIEYAKETCGYIDITYNYKRTKRGGMEQDYISIPITSDFRYLINAVNDIKVEKKK